LRLTHLVAEPERLMREVGRVIDVANTLIDEWKRLNREDVGLHP
jgi:hypothetical protein